MFSSARTHHYRLPLCLCWCKKTFLQNLRDTRGICKIKDQWLADAAMASPKNESGFAIHINDSDQVGSVKVKYLCPCHLLIRGRPYIAQPVWTLFLFKSIWTRSQGSQGCQKIRFFLQIKLLNFCARIAPKRHKLRKIIKIEKNVKKTLFS